MFGYIEAMIVVLGILAIGGIVLLLLMMLCVAALAVFGGG